MRALAITGPTASGKTALSLAIARRIPSEIISCDSESDITDTVVEQLVSEGGRLIHEEQYQN